MASFAEDVLRSEATPSGMAEGVPPVGTFSPDQPRSPKSFSEMVLEAEAQQKAGTHAIPPQERDRAARERFLTGQATSQGFKTPAAGPMGEPGFNEFWARADIALSDSFAGKQAKFKAKFPDGDFIMVPEPPRETGSIPLGRGGNTILFRRNSNEQFAEFDPSVIDKFELLGDIADISGSVPAGVAQAIITRGGSLGMQAVQLFGGSVLGDTAKRFVEEMRGYNKQTFGENVAETVAEAGISTATGMGVGAVVGGPINALRGAASIRLQPGAEDAQRAMRALGAPAFLPHHVAAQPMIQAWGKQAQATVASIGEYIANQQRALITTLSGLSDRNVLKFAQGAVKGIHDDAVTQIISAVKTAKPSLGEGGAALQAGIAEYTMLSQALVDRAYNLARMKDSPEFDISPALAVARDVKANMLGMGKKGKPIDLSVTSPAIRAEIGRLEALDPSLPPVTLSNREVATATDQLRQLRQNLFNLKEHGPLGALTPERRQEAAQAKKLYSALTHVLENPKNADPGFVSAWKAANMLAKERFETLEKTVVMNATKSETPAMMADRLAAPLQIDNVKVLKDALPADKFAIFQDAVKWDFLRPEKVDGLTKRINQFDRETLDQLLPRSVQADLKNVGTQIDRLNQIGIKDILTRQSEGAAIVRDLVNRKDTAGLSELISRVTPLSDSSAPRRALRAGIVEDVWNAVTVPGKAGPEIDGKALAAEIGRLKASGADKLLTSSDMAVMNNFEKIAMFLKSSKDPGTSITAASTAASIRGGAWSGFRTLMEAMGTGRLYTSPTFQRIVLGSGAEKLPFNSLRVIGAMLGHEYAGIEHPDLLRRNAIERQQ